MSSVDVLHGPLPAERAKFSTTSTLQNIVTEEDYAHAIKRKQRHREHQPRIHSSSDLDTDRVITIIPLRGSNSVVDFTKLTDAENVKLPSKEFLPNFSGLLGKGEPWSISQWSLNVRYQRMAAWQPVIRTKTIWQHVCLYGLVIFTLGVIMLACDLRIHEVVIPYSIEPSCQGVRDQIQQQLLKGNPCKENCTYVSENECEVNFVISVDMYTPVYLYYEVTNLYQNYRKFAKSKDEKQLSGKIWKFHSQPIVPWDCYPLHLNHESKLYYPCGAYANAMFSDVITLGNESGHEIPASKEGISFSSLANLKYAQPDGMDPQTYYEYRHGSFVESFTRPKDWSELRWKEWFHNGGVQSPDFVNWMQPSFSSTVRKLYGAIIGGQVSGCTSPDVLCKGNYQIRVLYRYDVDSFNGEKNAIIATTSFFGERNLIRSACTISIGILTLLGSLLLYAVRTLRSAKKLKYRAAGFFARLAHICRPESKSDPISPSDMRIIRKA